MKVGAYKVPGYYVGDVIDCLRMLPDDCINCVVTSPPYYGLRAYAGDQNVVWGGAADCEHDWTEKERLTTSGGPPGKTAQVGATVAGVQRGKVQEATCSKCGAWKGGFGAEPTPEMYVEHTVEILREIRRVLRPDGTCFWVIGDSYAGVGWSNHKNTGGALRAEGAKQRHTLGTGLKNKDLLLIPHRVALAAQADGWYVRSDIIWVKGASFGPYVGNPMPESINDRPTSAHEHIWMFTKRPKYYWDAEAVREPSTMKPQRRPQGHKRRRPGSLMPEHTWSGTQRDEPQVDGNPAGRNVRNCWTIPTRAFKGAHFAVFPPDLPMRLIEAACPRQVCSVCGAPWTRIMETAPLESTGAAIGGDPDRQDGGTRVKDPTGAGGNTLGRRRVATDRFAPSCICTISNQPCELCGGSGDPCGKGGRCIRCGGTGKDIPIPKPGIVLDPFAGSGTTLAVAECLGRDWIGFDISEEYGNLFAGRVEDVKKWFAKREEV